MKREQAEKYATEYLKPIYGFALKRCANLQNAEDLTQEIVLKVFHALLCREDIEAPDKFIWTVARNTLANYYRGNVKTAVGVSIDDLVELLPSDDNTANGIIEKENIYHLHREIAYFSKLQRWIVIAYCFENKKQKSITGELTFNPIQFELCGTGGSPGTKGANNNFFRSVLSQNIVYSVWKETKTVGEIADNLGVSPVYVESEAEYLAEYDF